MISYHIPGELHVIRDKNTHVWAYMEQNSRSRSSHYNEHHEQERSMTSNKRSWNRRTFPDNISTCTCRGFCLWESVRNACPCRCVQQSCARRSPRWAAMDIKQCVLKDDSSSTESDVSVLKKWTWSSQLWSNLSSCEESPEKNLRLQRDLSPWPPRYRFYEASLEAGQERVQFMPVIWRVRWCAK